MWPTHKSPAASRVWRRRAPVWVGESTMHHPGAGSAVGRLCLPRRFGRNLSAGCAGGIDPKVLGTSLVWVQPSQAPLRLQLSEPFAFIRAQLIGGADHDRLGGDLEARLHQVSAWGLRRHLGDAFHFLLALGLNALFGVVFEGIHSRAEDAVENRPRKVVIVAVARNYLWQGAWVDCGGFYPL